MSNKCHHVPLNSARTSGGPEQINNYSSAGIVPYHYDGNNIYFLLGYDPNDQQWKCFGGSKESEDLNNPRNTAYRETVEETCQWPGYNKCYLHLNSDIKPKLYNGRGICIPKSYIDANKNGTWNNFYFISIDKQKWQREFGDNKDDIPVSNIQKNEVNRMKWFTKDEIDKYGQKRKDNPRGQIHAPLFAIIRDHYNDILWVEQSNYHVSQQTYIPQVYKQNKRPLGQNPGDVIYLFKKILKPTAKETILENLKDEFSGSNPTDIDISNNDIVLKFANEIADDSKNHAEYFKQAMKQMFNYDCIQNGHTVTMKKDDFIGLTNFIGISSYNGNSIYNELVNELLSLNNILSIIQQIQNRKQKF